MIRDYDGLVLQAHVGGQDHRLVQAPGSMVYQNSQASFRLAEDGRPVLDASPTGDVLRG